MYFKRIEMQGFKSFSEPVTIEFNEGITCVVGPNGSGKSNIADAIRWVLGEQSPKMLRGGKMEEVIFAGTANRKSRGMAEVTLTIDNSQKILPIDYAEVAITRRVYRSGESEYSINKVPCRLKDIRELIMDTGIGVDGYSIIGQGRIADIVSSRPDSRREIFEEAAGIVKYRSKKAESQRKLETSRGNLERVDDIVAEIEGRIDGLREDSIKAKEYIGLRDRYKELEINVTLKNIDNIELKNEYIKDDLMEAQQQIDGCVQEKETIDKALAEGKGRIQELEDQATENREKLMAAVDEINRISGDRQLQQERLQTIDKDRQRLAEEAAGFGQKLEKEEANARELKHTMEGLEADLAAARAELEQKSAEHEKLSGELEAGEAAAERNRNRVYELHSLISAKSSEINSLKGMQESIGKRKAELLEEQQASNKVGSSLRDAYEDALQRRKTLKERQTRNRQNYEEARRNYDKSEARQQVLKQSMEELRLSMGQATARKKIIDEMEIAYEGYHHGVKFVMESGIQGLHGTVAELITVPQGYETAIEIALGGALQNIVCDNDRNAKEAIAALKSNRAGRLTFLPIGSMNPGSRTRDESLRQATGFQGFGTECVEFNKQYRGVMEYLLGRVVVVDNIDNAVALSKKNAGGLRFVTLEGELINAGGAITGGAAKNRAAGLLERKAEGQRLGEALARMEMERISEEKELSGLKDILLSMGRALEKLEQEHRAQEIDLLNVENEINGLFQRLSDSDAARDKGQRELNSISKDENDSAAMTDALEKEISEAERELQQVEAAVAGSAAVYEAGKQRAEAAAEAATEARVKAAAAESEKNNGDRILAQIQSHIEDFAQEIKSREDASAELLRQKEEMTAGREDAAEALRRAEREKQGVEELLKDIAGEKEQKAKETGEMESRKAEIDALLLNSQTQKHEMELKLTKNETQVEAYKEKLWEDFEISYIQAIEFRKSEFVMGAAQRESREIRNRMKELGEVNVGAIKEYESVSERYEFLRTQREDLLGAIGALEQIIEDMDKTIKQSFKESFDQVAANFEEAFRALFGGGTAELRLDDESNPLECGIDIIAHPPGKKVMNLNLMSGGEKTLTAIALMFAILKSRPTPFCILDEVEASLDEVNIERFSKYLRQYEKTQFAIITHQKATMEYADALYGVTMPEQGISKVISLRLGDDFEVE